MTDRADDLDAIAPAASTAMLKGQSIEIKPLTVGKIPTVLRLLKGIDLSMGLEDLELVALVADHGETLVQVVEIAYGLEKGALADCDGAEFLTLLAKALEVNIDFFAARMLPALARVGAFRAAAKTGAGQTASSN